MSHPKRRRLNLYEQCALEEVLTVSGEVEALRVANAHLASSWVAGVSGQVCAKDDPRMVEKIIKQTGFAALAGVVLLVAEVVIHQQGVGVLVRFRHVHTLVGFVRTQEGLCVSSCCICLHATELAASALLSPCGHRFCARCIFKWLAREKILGAPGSCPICRGSPAFVLFCLRETGRFRALDVVRWVGDKHAERSAYTLYGSDLPLRIGVRIEAL